MRPPYNAPMEEHIAPLELTPAQRKELKARAHHLDPVVMIGEAGATEPVLAETERALAAHGLIKIRVLGDDRDLRVECMRTICERLGCAPVQMIGKLLVVWRPGADEDDGAKRPARRRNEPHLPKKAAGAGAKKAAKPATRRSKADEPVTPRVSRGFAQAKAVTRTERDDARSRTGDRPPRPSTRKAAPAKAGGRSSGGRTTSVGRGATGSRASAPRRSDDAAPRPFGSGPRRSDDAAPRPFGSGPRKPAGSGRTGGGGTRTGARPSSPKPPRKRG